MVTKEFAGVGKPQRGDKAYISAFVSPESKRRLIAAAKARGVTISALLEAMAAHAEPISQLLPPTINGQ